jgi:molybdopterin converting factor small subunit
MPRIPVHLPPLLADAVGAAEVQVDAGTLTAALDGFRRRHPRAATHVYDDTGRQRRHVLIFLNDRDTRWIEDPSLALRDGDRLRIIQAISGG